LLTGFLVKRERMYNTMYQDKLIGAIRDIPVKNQHSYGYAACQYRKRHKEVQRRIAFEWLSLIHAWADGREAVPKD